MSSLVRRIQKNITKAQGFYRKDGKIHNSNGEVVGLHWPQVAAPTRKED